ncbi:MAG: ABC transporter ATP-binding protein [Gammaproteobacteria bacterium]|nr:ABC transporter ATP-binding protein [Gammaproteobacteria bacterium]
MVVEAAVAVEGLVRRYGEVEALAGIDLRVPGGALFALLGPNGAGKTTLFSILTTLRRPTSGRARVLGLDVVRERSALRRRIGVVFQEPALEQKLTVRDNLLLMAWLYGVGGRIARRRVEQVLDRLDLTAVAGRPAAKLSGGQKRRVELARALIPQPEVLFLDEATLGLDVDARRSFWVHIRQLAASGTTVFFTTHYMEEAEVAQRIAMIDRGRVVADGSPTALKARIGGGVIWLNTADDAGACDWLLARGLPAERAQHGVLLVDPAPAERLPGLLTELPFKVLRAEVHEPGLEDVFVKLTGRGLDNDAATGSESGVQVGWRP